MATTADPAPPGKINFAGMIGAKRRRMRSGGTVQSINNDPGPNPVEEDTSDIGEEKTAQTSKCKGSTTIPIFLKKTYKMIDTCDPNVASWTPDGEMFVVKDPDMFAASIIPQYFDHNKFSSFARQLNFYGFRKMQSKPIRNSDFDAGTAKHVTFYNENFKRGRCDLLKKIQRSTRGGGTNTAQDHQREVQGLKEQVSTLEQKISDMERKMEERLRHLELDMLGRMEQMMLAMHQQQQLQLQHSSGTSTGGTSNTVTPALGNSRQTTPADFLEPLPFAGRAASTASAGMGLFGAGNTLVSAKSTGSNAPGPGPTLPPHPKQKPMPPTLPPHPKQKELPPVSLPGTMGVPPLRLNSLARGLSRGLSGLSRGASVESSASAVLLRNSWEDKFFSMIMLGESENAAAAAAAQQIAGLGQAAAGNFGGFSMSDAHAQLAASNLAANGALTANHLQQLRNLTTGSNTGIISQHDRNRSLGPPQLSTGTNPDNDMSSVSSADMP